MMDLHDIFQGRLTEQKWKRLGDYLKGRGIHAGHGITIQDSSSSGTIISAEQVEQIPPTQAPPFSVLAIRHVPESDPAEYKIQMQEGWVIERDTLGGSGTDAIDFHQVSIGAQLMSARPRAEITVRENDWVYLHYKTNDKGYVKQGETVTAGGITYNLPAVIPYSSTQSSVHHQPPSGECGTSIEGSYFIKLFQFVLEDNGPKIVVYQQSDVEHSKLPNFENVGGERFIHSKRNGASDQYEFKTLEQVEPTGRTFGKVIVPVPPGESECDSETIKFSAIAERASSPQVNVEDDGAGVITIKGNNNDGSLTWEYCEAENGQTSETLLTWKDGLITSENASFKAGCAGLPTGYSGDILYHNGTDWVVLTNPGVNAAGEGWVLAHSGTFPEWLPYDGDDF